MRILYILERFRVKKLIYLISISIAWKIVSYIIEWRDGEMQKIKKVYSLLADEKSKTIFENGVMYRLTGDYKYIRRIIRMDEGATGSQIFRMLNKTLEHKAIFGAGITGSSFFQRNNDIRFNCFIDNYKYNSECNGLPVLSPGEFKSKYSGEGIIIIPETKLHLEMYEQLVEMGFNRNNIIDCMAELKKLMHLQYFDLPQLKERKENKEIFVDGGAYDGTSSVEFVKWCSGCRKKIYVWEPDVISREACSERLKKIDVEYKIIPKGLWKDTELLRFDMQNNSCSNINDEGTMIIEVDSIDNIIKEPVTFIKMDIEGAEYQALLGAKNMITQYKPKLAIAVYHKPEDLWQLPYLIYEISPTYTFYLRHYSLDSNEIVLYAI